MSPVANPPVFPVRVWATWSLLVTVTLVPAVTVSVPGEKAKFLMVMVCEPPVSPPADPLEDEGVLPDEQAATASATPSTTTAAVLRERRCRLPLEVPVMPVGWAVDVIARYSEEDPTRMYRNRTARWRRRGDLDWGHPHGRRC